MQDTIADPAVLIGGDRIDETPTAVCPSCRASVAAIDALASTCPVCGRTTYDCCTPGRCERCQYCEEPEP